jgi:hypothetical protein
LALPVLLVGAAVATAAVYAVAIRGEGGDGWKTYRNQQFGYEIRYPPDWTIAVRDPLPTDDFEYQDVDFAHGPDSAGVTVNFQGGWCESGACPTRDINVSGVAGREYLWDWDEDGAVDVAVRHFGHVEGDRNYTVMGRIVSDRATVERIIETFRFMR